MDTAGNNTQFVYDSLGRKITQTDPDLGVWHYEYDGVGNETKQTDARIFPSAGLTMNWTGSPNRLSTDTDITYQYDTGKIGTLSQQTDAAGTVNYIYDNRLRKIQEQRITDGITWTTQYAYDAADRMTSRINPDGETVSYAFNPQGEINSVSGVLTNVDYNALNKITKKDFANSLSTNYTYIPMISGLTESKPVRYRISDIRMILSGMWPVLLIISSKKRKLSDMTIWIDLHQPKKRTGINMHISIIRSEIWQASRMPVIL